MQGWLDAPMHACVREILIHTLARYHLVCPAYCLMPDHAHFFWMGTHGKSDQQAAAMFFRKHWNRALREGGFALQKQGYDHVLNEHERNRSEFEDTLGYVLKNAERGGLVGEWREWPYLGAAAAGFPDLDPREVDGMGRFWKVHATLLRKGAEEEEAP